MKRGLIFYFSGTGNTGYVTELLKKEFAAEGFEIDLFEITEKSLEKVPANFWGYDIIGIGHPVYGFDSPRLTVELVKKLPQSKGTSTFIFKTAGALSSFNNGASKRIIRILRKKGYNVFNEKIYPMPSNWLMKYTAPFSKQLCDSAAVYAKKHVGELVKGEKSEIHSGFLINLFAVVLNFMEDEISGRLFGKNLIVKKSCNKCLKCVNQCPHSNIKLKNNKIVFGWNCGMCMKCIYGCPVKAIKGTFYGFPIFDDGYNVQGIIKDNTITEKFVDENTTGHFAQFKEYIVNNRKE